MTSKSAALGEAPSSGIYEIFNRVSFKRYVGSAVNFKQRWRDHRKALRRGSHHSSKLQHSWNKYGESAFIFRELLTCAPTKKMLLFYEQQVLDLVIPEYNICKVAGSALGTKHTPAQCAANSARQRGRKQTPEHIAKCTAARTGKKTGPRSLEQRERIASSLRGKKRPPRSAETKKKISDAHKGRVFLPEHIANIKLAARRRSPRPRNEHGQYC